MREITQRSGACRQCRQRQGQIPFHGLRFDLVVAADPVEIAVAKLPKLMNPVRELDVWITAQLCECSCRLGGAKKCGVELAEQDSSSDGHLTQPDRTFVTGCGAPNYLPERVAHTVTSHLLSWKVCRKPLENSLSAI